MSDVVDGRSRREVLEVGGHRLARWSTLFALSASVALVVAGCGGSADPSPGSGASASPPIGSGVGASVAPVGGESSGSAASLDSCVVLTDDEIETATGERVTERRPSTLTQVFPSVCEIKLDGGGEVTVKVLPSGGRRMWTDSFEPTIGSDVLDEAVSDLGDAAARSGDEELMFLQDDMLFEVIYLNFGRDNKLPVVRYLAEIVLAKSRCGEAVCASETPPPPPVANDGLAACELLTEAEIKDATGFAATLDQERSSPNDCTWTLDTDSTVHGFDMIGLTVRSSGGRQLFDMLAEGQEHITGLGDDAVKLGGNIGGSVMAVTGDRAVTVNYSLPVDTVDPYPLVTPLLRLALSRL